MGIILTKEEKRQFYKALLVLALPMVLQMAVTTSLSFIDAFMITSLGTATIGGVTAANRIYFVVQVVGFGVFTGGAVLTAQFHGVDDRENIRRVLGICISFVLAFSGVVAIASFVFPEFFISLVSDKPEEIREGAKYIKIVALSYAFTVVSGCYSTILKSIEQVKVTLYISTLAVAVNTILNYALIFGNLGAPN